MITVKGCVQKKELELLTGDHSIRAFVMDADYLRLWPREYVPATLTIEEAEINAHVVKEPLREVM